MSLGCRFLDVCIRSSFWCSNYPDLYYPFSWLSDPLKTYQNLHSGRCCVSFVEICVITLTFSLHSCSLGVSFPSLAVFSPPFLLSDKSTFCSLFSVLVSCTFCSFSPHIKILNQYTLLKVHASHSLPSSWTPSGTQNVNAILSHSHFPHHCWLGFQKQNFFLNFPSSH